MVLANFVNLKGTEGGRELTIMCMIAGSGVVGLRWVPNPPRLGDWDFPIWKCMSDAHKRRKDDTKKIGVGS